MMKPIYEHDPEYFCDIQAPCFQGLLPEELDLVRESKTQVLFRKGENLTKQGAFASYVLFIVSGFVRQYIEGDSSRNFNLRILQAGEFVGLSSVFSNDTFNYSSIALTDCQAFLVEKQAISGIVKQNGMFGFNIIGRYCQQNANLYQTLHTILYKQMNGRMASVLLYVDSLKKVNPEIFQLLSRKDIAEFAGISTESAVKLLKGFQKDGLIALKEKDVILKDHQGLQDISRRG